MAHVKGHNKCTYIYCKENEVKNSFFKSFEKNQFGITIGPKKQGLQFKRISIIIKN